MTLTKGGEACGETPCCWSGSDEDGSHSILTWADGVWSMQLFVPDPFAPGEFLQAGYEGVGTPCDDPIVLNLVDSSPGYDWPDPLVLSSGSMMAAAPAPAPAAAPEVPKVKPPKAKWTGFGDVVASATKAVGIKPCGGCQKRQEWLNKKIPFSKGEE